MKRLLPIIPLVLIPLLSQAQRKSDQESLRISLKDKSWAVQIDAPTFVVKQNPTQADGRKYLLAESPDATLSISLEKVTGAATLDGCKQSFQGRIQPNPQFKFDSVKQSQSGEMALLEYMIMEFQGAPIEQKNIFGCLAREDVYVDIHISKVTFKPADQQKLNKILSSVSFAAMGSPEKPQTTAGTSAALVAEGSKFFVQNQYDKAIGSYQRALDLEKQEQRLNTTMRRVLIDNLAMAYGITGKLANSEEVLNYGLSKDPTYPMFYFIMADGYAERNDLDNAIKYLRLALKYRDNMIPGEKLPDPREDDSFKRFLTNEVFKKFLAEFH